MWSRPVYKNVVIFPAYNDLRILDRCPTLSRLCSYYWRAPRTGNWPASYTVYSRGRGFFTGRITANHTSTICATSIDVGVPVTSIHADLTPRCMLVLYPSLLVLGSLVLLGLPIDITIEEFALARRQFIRVGHQEAIIIDIQ
jgi:hypothetical protein